MRKLLAITVLGTLFAAPAFSHSDSEDKTIQYRQSIYHVIGEQMGQLGAMAKKKIPYDQAQALLAADTIAQLAKVAPASFKAGSYGIDGTSALNTISQQPEDFDKAMQDFQLASAKLATKLNTASQFPRPEFGAMAQTCKACHTDFKAK